MDKMFIRLNNFTTDENGKLKKIEYDYDSTPEKQSREARENALLDIELGILRNKQVDEALFNPGSFDEIKRESRIAQIMSDRANNGSSLLSIWQDEHNIKYENIDEAIDSVNSASLDELKKFVERFAEKRSLLSIDTFIYNHQQNMSGAALIGMYANNTTGQAKMQTTRLGIVDALTFNIEGRRIKSLHDMYSTKHGIKERISKRCAYFSAASVDNVKDPCLRKIGQNTNTAHIAAFMLRAGLDVQEISLLFSQPFIKFNIDKTGKVPSSKSIKDQLDYLNKRYKTSIKSEDIEKIVSTHDYTTKELTKNIVIDSRNTYMQERDIESMSRDTRDEIVRNAALALYLFDRIANLANQLRGSVQISRADSPNGAISNELHKANRQVKAIDEYMGNASKPGWGIEYISDIMSNNVLVTSDSKKQMRAKLLSQDVRIPRLQAFYSLGIELAQDLISKYFISQSTACQNIVNKIEKEVDARLDDNALKVLYNDFVTYILTGTEEFGDSKEGSFENKRDYYLYQYPQRFSEIIQNNPKLAALSAITNLRVSHGQIIMDRSGKITPTLRESIMQSFDTLLFGTDKEGSQLAYDLFRYSFYNEGFIFRHNSYGQFFSATFLSNFGEVMDALRIVPDSRNMEKFFDQWVAQKSNLKYFKTIPEGQGITISDNSFKLETKNVPMNTKTGRPYHYVVWKEGLYGLSGTDELGATYSNIPLIDAGPTEGTLHKFNANENAIEIAANKVNKDRVDNLKKLNALSFKRKSAIDRSSETALADNIESMIDEESFMPEIENAEETFVDDTEFIMEYDFENGALDFANQIQEEYDENLGQKTLIDNGEKPLCK